MAKNSYPSKNVIIQHFNIAYQLNTLYQAIQWDCITDNELIIKRAFAENILMESTKTNKTRIYGLTPYAPGQDCGEIGTGQGNDS